MSEFDPPETPPGIPEEYADVYREAYLRALAEQEPPESAVEQHQAPLSRRERIRAERARAQQARAEKAEAERAEAERVRAVRAEAERVEAERVRAVRAEAERVEAERVRAVRAEAERAEAERVEAERVEAASAEVVQQNVVAEGRQTQAAAETVDFLDGTRDVVSDDPEDARSGRWWLAVAVLSLLLIIASYIVGDQLAGDEDLPAGSEAQVTSTTPVDPSGKPQRKGDGPAVWNGPVQPVTVSSGQASCTAASGIDAANQPVDYSVENALDDDPSTAWRCDGTGIGEVITLTLADEVEVAEIGLIPGYAKTDPVSGTDRYAENNRITRVRWTLSDGVVVNQKLDPDPTNRSPQSVRVQRTQTGEVTLEIRRVQQGERNISAISSIVVSAAS